jgi:hypothetical protein
MSSMVEGATGDRLVVISQSRSGIAEFFRYHGAWAPGVRLFRSIGFRAKAMVISVVFAVPMALLAWAYFSDKAANIGFSAKERVGVAYVRDAVPLLRALQRERFLALQAVAKGSEPAELAAVRGGRSWPPPTPLSVANWAPRAHWPRCAKKGRRCRARPPGSTRCWLRTTNARRRCWR